MCISCSYKSSSCLISKQITVQETFPSQMSCTFKFLIGIKILTFLRKCRMRLYIMDNKNCTFQNQYCQEYNTTGSYLVWNFSRANFSTFLPIPNIDSHVMLLSDWYHITKVGRKCLQGEKIKITLKYYYTIFIVSLLRLS